ncbi:MAG: MTAP family purine nucleoside phosphorylase [Planctomycetota bacterium]
MRIGIIGGTGIGERLVAELGGDAPQPQAVDTPFGPPSADLLLTTLRPDGGQAVDVALLSRHGDGHAVPPHMLPARANIYAMKALGVTHIVATGAVGSLREEIRPGEVVVCDQLIDRTAGRARTFFDDLAVHVEFAEPFCPVMRQWLLDASPAAGVKVHPTGACVVIDGPSFSTRAESLMHRQWGADLVGMTVLPEARLAREAEIAYAMLALPTDDDAWRPRAVDAPSESLLTEIIGNLQRASDAALRVLQSALADVAALRAHTSPAHDALRHAVWTSSISVETASRLGMLLERHVSNER